MEHRVRISQTGAPEAMVYESFDAAEPGPGEALIRHGAIGVNMIDTYHRSGLYAVTTPFTPGVEAAGVIEKLGTGTADLGLHEGQRVAYVVSKLGAYASVATVPA